jgi:putative transcriptional regulator
MMKVMPEKRFYSLAPTLLLSMPQLNDPNFRRTVVLLCKHTREGAFGLVVNRPMITPARVTMKTDPPVVIDKELELWIGGPVEPERSWILLGHDPGDSEAVEIAPSVFLSTSPTLLKRLLEPTPPPRSRLLVGYAGWGPGQLDAELGASAWLTADVEVDLLFDVPAATVWETAIRRLGADPATLQMGFGVH